MKSKLIVFGREGCVYCSKALDVAYRNEIEYVYFDVRKDQTARKLLLAMGHKTVPQIFEGSQYIGGFDDFVKHLHSKG